MLSGSYGRFKHELVGQHSDTRKLARLIEALVTFKCCRGYTSHSPRQGYRARASASHPALLAPLLELLEGKVHIRRKGVWVWANDKKAIAQWLEKAMNHWYAPKPPKLPKGVCKHCGQEEGHDPECCVGGGAD